MVQHTARGTEYAGVRRNRRRLARSSLRLLACASVLAAAAPSASALTNSPYAIHSMLQLGSPYVLKQEMFAHAAAAGASEIRVDVSLGELSDPFVSSAMWSAADDYAHLSEQYGIRVLADLSALNDPQLQTCQPGADPRTGLCGVTNLPAYYAEVSALVQHVRGAIDDFEVVNEPDIGRAFTGTPQQYAGMLATAYQAVHDNDQAGRVLLGGIGSVTDANWVATVFVTPGFNAAHKFDIANVHLRGPLDGLPGDVLAWRRFFAFFGDAAVPLWVTETGYPSNPIYQYDPSFKGYDQTSGEDQQAAFLAKSLPALLFGGAAKVFVTERDNLTGQYASEGLIGGQVSDSDGASPNPVLKPAYHVFALLAHATAAGIPPTASGEPAHLQPSGVGTTGRTTWATEEPGRPRRRARWPVRAARRCRARASP